MSVLSHGVGFGTFIYTFQETNKGEKNVIKKISIVGNTIDGECK